MVLALAAMLHGLSGHEDNAKTAGVLKYCYRFKIPVTVSVPCNLVVGKAF